MISEVTNGTLKAEKAVVDAFLREIGLLADSPVADTATFAGVFAALEGELLLPLRALNEGQESMQETAKGEEVDTDLLYEKVQDMTSAVLSGPGGFAAWRYTCPEGREQLRGLSKEQVALWREPTAEEHAGGLRTHEDEEGELGFFWGTKIGGPSHGFDHTGLCILPLLANARHKVLLVSDPAWPDYPAGRAHFRLLWTPDEEPRLWLEPVQVCFAAAHSYLDIGSWQPKQIEHALNKAEAMQVPLSVDPRMASHLNTVVAQLGATGTVRQTTERMVLRPSNSIVESSDFLSQKHDWVQMEEEVTEPISRVVYFPEGCD
jgi:hypothetical protein